MNRRSMATFRHLLASLAVLSGAVAVAGAAAAQEGGWRFWTGKELLKSCEATLSGRVGCTSYIAGVIDSHETYASSGYGRRLFCPPSGVKVGQFRDRVVQFLKAHPGSRGRPAAALTAAAMQAAYPCPAGKRR